LANQKKRLRWVRIEARKGLRDEKIVELRDESRWRAKVSSGYRSVAVGSTPSAYMIETDESHSTYLRNAQ
jgi:hypothetical protein